MFSAVAPGRVQRSIKKFQKLNGYHEDHARWHHAAVYIGNYLICEATRTGVKHAEVFDYVGNSLIRVRRDTALSSEQSSQIAINALLRLRSSYSFSAVLKLWWQCKRGSCNKRYIPRVPSPLAVICSQLYGDAHMAVSGKALDKDANQPITPASLSETTLLQDIKTSWLNII